MMDWTDRHCRFFLRGLSPRVVLYTEMITAAAIEHGDVQRLLAYSPQEHPIALQLGGSEPAALAHATRMGTQFGYDEINLNCGCPSDRVHAGTFGACLMRVPERVAECITAMVATTSLPVTVKLRIGVLEGSAARVADFTEADFEALHHFVQRLAQAGCARFIVHARKAVLGGLSPKENREVPPLRYDVVQRLKRELPQLAIEVNGGVRTADEGKALLAWADGVMLGREAYHRPQVLAELHARVFGDGWQPPSSAALLERMISYAERELAGGERLAAISRHLLGLCNGQPGARRYRQLLSEGARGLQGPGAREPARALLRSAAELCAA